MSSRQRRRRLRRRQSESARARLSTRAAAVTFTGSLLSAASVAVVPVAAHAQTPPQFEVSQVADVAPGGNSSFPYGFRPAGDKMFFVANDGVEGDQLWVSDGTTSGTTMLTDVTTHTNGGDPSRYAVRASGVIGGDLYFQFDDGTHGFELWRSDGTVVGTAMVKDIDAGADSSYANDFVAFDGKVFFTAYDATHGESLWETDGTAAGTSLVKTPGPAESSLVGNLTVAGNTLFFEADDGVHGRELWSSDGTAAGTSLVADINPGPDGGLGLPDLTAVGDHVFFTADDGTHGAEVWTSDGTSAGTRLVRDVKPGESYYDLSPGSLTAVGDRLYFTEDDGTHGRELWTTDGTTAGTHLVKDIDTAENGAAASAPDDLLASGSTLYFTADDGIHGRQVWRSDGAAAGTTAISDFTTSYTGGYGHDGPEHLAAFQGTLFFSAEDGVHGRELWQSDGTATGTQLVSDITPGSVYTGFSPIAATDDELFFTADDEVHGAELWQAQPSNKPAVANTGQVTVSGSAVVGGTLSATTGSWSPADVTLRYQWLSDGSPIEGATGPTYHPVGDDVGQRISVWVSASHDGYRSTTSTSAQTAAVAPPRTSNRTPPTVSGTDQVGKTLVGSPGTWVQSGLTYAYRWYATGLASPLSRTRRLSLPPGAAGRTITLRVTASKTGLEPDTVSSRPTVKVRLGVLAVRRHPRVTGRAIVGRRLVVAPGSVAPAAAHVLVHWLRDGHPITGATQHGYVLTGQDRGARISCRVTFARPGYRSLVVVVRTRDAVS